MLRSGELDSVMGSSPSTQASISAAWAKAMGGRMFARLLLAAPPDAVTAARLAEFGIPADEAGWVRDEDYFIPTRNFTVVVSAVKRLPHVRGQAGPLLEGMPGARLDEDGAIAVHALELDGQSRSARVWKIRYGTEVRRLERQLEGLRASKTLATAQKALKLGHVLGRYGAFERSAAATERAIEIANWQGRDDLAQRYRGQLELFTGVEVLTHRDFHTTRSAISHLEAGFRQVTEDVTLLKRGARRVLAILHESDGDFERSQASEGRGSYEEAANFYRHALDVEPENIGLLAKARRAELQPAIDAYGRWEAEQRTAGRQPSRL
ncbi:MAG: hypothetical protein Q8S13_10015, partial [Dehalococcoidia bacterium]|nr:hypothetical protein [Dehalococcoidia bacterium]